MAKDSKHTAPEVNANGNGTPEETPAATPSRFQQIATERFMFNAQKCYADLPAAQRLPLVGYLLNMIPMPPIKGREWEACVVRTTEPCNVVNREKQVIKVDAGSEVLIPATDQISRFLAKAATHPGMVFEVSIRPNKKIDIGGGQTMWTYDLGANPRPIPRTKFGVAGLLEGAGDAPALPAAGGEAAAGDDDIPF